MGWHPCIESNLVETKTLLLTDSCSQCERRIIGVLMPECRLSVMEEVLPIEEGNGSLDCWLRSHTQKITPPGPFGKSDGE